MFNKKRTNALYVKLTIKFIKENSKVGLHITSDCFKTLVSVDLCKRPPKIRCVVFVVEDIVLMLN